MNLDFQTLINVGMSGAMAVFGWFARELWSAVKAVREDVAKLREELPKTYITKDDFKDGVTEIKQLLIAIDSKLDRKLDKP
jgi:hypothetical protein